MPMPNRLLPRSSNIDRIQWQRDFDEFFGRDDSVFMHDWTWLKYSDQEKNDLCNFFAGRDLRNQSGFFFNQVRKEIVID